MKRMVFAATAAVSAAAVSTACAQSAPASIAQPTHDSSATALAALMAEWDRAGFTPPSKPSQYRVYGRKGYVTSGPTYNAMVTLIRAAFKDYQEGRHQDALVKAAKVRSLLDH